MAQAAASTVVIPLQANGDLLVSVSEGKDPGLYLWEHAGAEKKNLFRAPRRLGDAVIHVMPSYVEGKLRVLAPGVEFLRCDSRGLMDKKLLPAIAGLTQGPQQWSYADFNGDGHQDLIVSRAFDEAALRLQGRIGSAIQVFCGRADGTFAKLFSVMVEGKPIFTTQLPRPNFANFDVDDDLDLLCVSADGGFIYYENSNTNSEPLYAAGKPLHDVQGKEISTRSKHIVPTAFDWDRDGDLDLIVGDAEGRVAWVEHTGTYREHMPIFLQPVYFQQSAPTP